MSWMKELRALGIEPVNAGKLADPRCDRCWTGSMQFSEAAYAIPFGTLTPTGPQSVHACAACTRAYVAGEWDLAAMTGDLTAITSLRTALVQGHEAARRSGHPEARYAITVLLHEMFSFSWGLPLPGRQERADAAFLVIRGVVNGRLSVQEGLARLASVIQEEGAAYGTLLEEGEGEARE